MQEIKLMMVENNEIIRNGIKHLFSDVKDIETIAEATTPTEALDMVDQVQSDVLLLSMAIPDPQFGLVSDLLLENPDARILVMSSDADGDRVREAVHAGASGFIPSDISKKELVDAIRTIASNEVYFSRKIAHLITQDFIKKVKNPQPEGATGAALITSREMEILKLIAEGLSSQEIATRLYISSRTVENHRANIMQKCRVRNAAHLVNWGYQHKILSVK